MSVATAAGLLLVLAVVTGSVLVICASVLAEISDYRSRTTAKRGSRATEDDPDGRRWQRTDVAAHGVHAPSTPDYDLVPIHVHDRGRAAAS